MCVFLSPLALDYPLSIHSCLFYLSVFPSSVVAHHSHLPLRSLSHTLLNFRHRCSSPCGSVTSICSLLSISAHLICRVLFLSPDSHMKTPAHSLVKGRRLQPTFSSSLISCAFALAQPSDDKLELAAPSYVLLVLRL